MISYVKGPLAEVMEDCVVIDTGGVGLEIRVPVSVLEQMPSLGTQVTLYTYFQVREDAMCLYGFLNRRDVTLFRQLLSVNGIGPKGALGLLSALSPDDLRCSIASGDAKAISKAPGVGVKTAQRVILDLKDKVDLADLMPVSRAVMEEVKAEGSAREAVEALTALGYSAGEAARAVSRVEGTEQMTAEDVLKASLKYLAFI
ncbi:MAG TPA: Holliday junction branch migration protein RuvA [Candidatus Hungatella pullicola]|nr:Holliday junction branch migration protein RuvA [Candidatus Hungatella pullicola]